MYAYENGYDTLITMDSDFTHRPFYIPSLVKASKDFDIVVASRYFDKDSLSEWNLFRKSLTMLGHFLTRYLLGLKYDASGAFRLYNLNNIDKNIFTTITSAGYSFFFESLFVLNFNDYKITEVPIKLPVRTYGHSKMKFSDMTKSLRLIIKLFCMKIFVPWKFTIEKKPDNLQQEEWEKYWSKDKKRKIYDFIASFYRKMIIKRTLNYFTLKYLHKGSKVLHAGCGSGEVDTDANKHFEITAFDLSHNALEIYRQVNGENSRTIQGSILAMPFGNGEFDGIYNLGVLEHFEEKEVIKILKEFHRVLNDKGRIILFIPPEYGLSVIFFKILKFIFRFVFFNKNIKFHPDEICRIRSKKHALFLLNSSGFKMVEYYFGIKDFFTYAIIVAEK
jgi:ubiquinone/menaquinone biosynthesis C-methylase UbiE